MEQLHKSAHMGSFVFALAGSTYHILLGGPRVWLENRFSCPFKVNGDYSSKGFLGFPEILSKWGLMVSLVNPTERAALGFISKFPIPFF